MMSDDRAERRRALFLELAARDIESEGLRPLADYVARFPHDAQLIAEAYELLSRPSEHREPRGQAAGEGGLGRYRLDREVGRGAFGVVFKAWDRFLGRYVAVKVFERGWTDDPERLVRFKREVATSSRVWHPSVATVHDAGIEDGHPYIAMRWVEGQTLDAWLDIVWNADSRMTPAHRDTILLLLERVAEALHAAHGQGVVHRDVKPRNIIVDTSGDPVIVDFGIALDLQSDHLNLSRTHDQQGTPYYMAPEQIRGDAADAQTDVWAVGVLLYEALARHRPFEGSTHSQVSTRILKADPAPLRQASPAIGRDLESIVATALEKERRHRYADAGKLAEDLCNVREGRSVSVRRPSPWRRGVRWMRREPMKVGLLVAILVATGCAGFVLARHAAWDADRRDLDARELRERAAELTDQGFTRLTTRDYATARSTFEEATRRVPDLLDAWVGKALSLRALEQRAALATAMAHPVLARFLATDRYLTNFLESPAEMPRLERGHDEVRPETAFGWLVAGYLRFDGGLLRSDSNALRESLVCFETALRYPGGQTLPFYCARARAAEAIGARAACLETSAILRREWPLVATARFHAGLASREWDLDAAMDDYRAAAALDPEDTRYVLGLGHTLLVSGHLSESEHVFRGLLAKWPESSLAHAHLASVLELTGRDEDALRHAEIALTLKPENLLALMRKANLLMRGDRHAEALAVLTTARALAGEDPTPAVNIVVTLDRLGRTQEALALADTLLKTYPNLPDDAFKNHVIILARSEKPMEALRVVQVALERGRETSDLLLTGAHLADGIGESPRAMTYCQGAVTKDPSFSQGWRFLGYLLSRKGSHEDAKNAYARAAQLCPFDPAIRADFVTQLLACHEPERALEELERPLDGNAAPPHHHCLRGEAMAALQRWTEASVAFRAGEAGGCRTLVCDRRREHAQEQLERQRDVEACITAVRSKRPSEAPRAVQLEAARELFDRADFAGALVLYHQILDVPSRGELTHLEHHARALVASFQLLPDGQRDSEVFSQILGHLSTELDILVRRWESGRLSEAHFRRSLDAFFSVPGFGDLRASTERGARSPSAVRLLERLDRLGVDLGMTRPPKPVGAKDASKLPPGSPRDKIR